MERVTNAAAQKSTLDLQRETLLVFTMLCAIDMSCRHRLALCYGGRLADAAALAVTGLGGTALLLGEETDRQPSCADFTVTNLTEALRILKNELRRGMPVSVCLKGDPAIHLAEMLERGLALDLLCAPKDDMPLLQPLMRSASAVLELPVYPSLQMKGFHIHTDVAGSFVERRQQDRHLQEVFASEASHPEPIRTVNARWMALVPKLFPRERNRHFWGAK